MSPDHTKEIYSELTKAYDYFNDTLFAGKLPRCIIVLHRKRNCAGYFWSEKWENGNKEHADELALNPDVLKTATLIDTLDTLVHEMCHVEQAHFGKPSRNGYHNKEWGGMMRAVGLIPSDTGKEGGKATGQRMTDYPEKGGLFMLAADAFIESGFNLDWFSNAAPKAPKGKSSKTKFTCPECEVNAWGKPDLEIECGPCQREMYAEED